MSEELLKSARLALQYSYSPYSNFRVGAAIRTDDGTIITGTNIENVSYGLAMCAERVAIFSAIAKGYSSFTELAVATSSGKPIFPCGACRQVLAEFSCELNIYLDGMTQQSFKLSDLLPNAFNKRDIELR
jgi:cytidine deaminase